MTSPRLLALLLLVATAAAGADFLKPCDIPGVKEKARCGTFEVWENREAKSGRRIGLKVVVLPATGSPSPSDAMTFLGGGPGEAITEAGPFLARQFASLRQHRDILLVDQRGTGGSHALECDLYPGKDPQTALGSFFPVERVRACRPELEKNADLRMYTTANSVDDLDEVRAALGYERLDVFGGSYGTRAGLEYLRRHPDRVRVAVLQGVVPPTKPMPLHFPESAQRAIDRVFDDCAAEPACHAAFPDLRGDLRAIIARAAAKPIPVEILNPQNGEPVHVSLSRNLLGESLRYLLYQSGSGHYVPTLVHQAAGGDFTPLAEFALGARLNLVNSLGQGLYLSVTCSEDLPYVQPAAAERAAANTFLGNYRYVQQRAACDAWPRGTVPAVSRQPVRSQASVLLFSGSWDPVTPDKDAQEVAATLPNSLSLVVAGGGHGYGGLPGADDCVAAVVGQFVERGSAKGVDSSCVGRVHHKPFPTAPVDSKTVTLTAEQQSALTGHYTGPDVPALDITVEKGHFVGRLEGEPDTIVLAPVSPTRLRFVGGIDNYIDFDVQNGKAASAVFYRVGTPAMRWKRGE